MDQNVLAYMAELHLYGVCMRGRSECVADRDGSRVFTSLNVHLMTTEFQRRRCDDFFVCWFALTVVT